MKLMTGGIVCFDEVDATKSACRLLLCKHRTCDQCLSMHVKVPFLELEGNR